jgi:sulfate transport system substrate-binding protein
LRSAPVRTSRLASIAASALIISIVAACGGAAATNRPSTGSSAAPSAAGSSSAPSAQASGQPSAAAEPTPAFESTPGAVTLVAYSTPREVYEEAIPLFQGTEAGAEVTFEESYGASGDQSRAVEAGLPADLVALSLWPDVNRLVEPGIVAVGWDQNDHAGIISNSVVVFAVRPGNPKNIQTWDDLIRDDVTVVTPNPFTSGGAQWNILAAYQGQIVQGKSEAEASEYLKQLISHTPVMDRSAREALATFSAGQGDVLLAYENEAIFAKNAGEPLDYVVPAQTILIENPISVTANGDATEAAQAFIDFLYTPEAQAIYASKGYRPEVEEALELAGVSFPEPESLFTIEDLGGWPEARPQFFDTEDGVVAQIFLELNLEV